VQIAGGTNAANHNFFHKLYIKYVFVLVFHGKVTQNFPNSQRAHSADSVPKG
jgi:hypothetical protein